MPTLTARTETTVDVQIGQILIINGVGNSWIIPLDANRQPLTPIIFSGERVVIGPSAKQAIYRIQCLDGGVNYEVTNSYPAIEVPAPTKSGGYDPIEAVGTSRMLAVRNRTPAAHRQFVQWLGAPADMALQFCEDANGASTWSQNLRIIEKIGKDWADIDVRHEYAFPLCSTTEPIADTISGKYDGIITACFRQIAKDDKHEIIWVRPGWEANNPNAYPWTFSGIVNGVQGTPAAFLAAYKRVVDLARKVSSRFRFALVWLPSTLGLDGQVVDPSVADPGPAYVDAYGQDFYADGVVELVGKDPLQLFYGKLNAAFGPMWLVGYAKAQNRPVCFPEMGTSFDSGKYYRAWFAFVRSIDCVYWGLYNVNRDQGQFKCQLSNGQYPEAEAEFIAQAGPVSILTADTFNAPTLAAFKSRIEANKSVQWSFGSDYGPFSISIGGDNRTVSLTAAAQPAGTRSVIIRATDERGQTAEKTITVNFAANAMQPETQMYIARAATTPNIAFQRAIDKLMTTIKLNALNELIDDLFVFSEVDRKLSSASLLSLRRSGRLIGNVSFASKIGARSDGVASYFDNDFFAAITSHRYQRDDNHFGLWSLTSNSRSGNTDAFEFGAGGTVSMFRVSNGNIAGRIGSTDAAVTLAGAGWAGHTMAVRTGATASRSYRKGIPVTPTFTTASAQPPFESFKTLAAQIANGQYGANDIAFVHYGSGLGWTDAKVLTLHNALDVCRQEILAA